MTTSTDGGPMRGQTAITMPAQPGLPSLPDGFDGSATSTYGPHKVNRRDHCGVCIWILHSAGGSFMPRAALYQRRDRDGVQSLEQFAYLCPQHRTEWRDRDDPARVTAGKKPW